MERHEFIQKIIELYPDTFKVGRVGHVQAWVEMYEKALPKSWDFDRLMWHFATEYKSTTIPPHPSFFYAFRNDVKPERKMLIYDNNEKKLSPEQEKANKIAMENFFSKCKEIAKNIDLNKC